MFVGGGLALPALGSEDTSLDAIVRRSCDAAEKAMASQITDPGHKHYGGFPGANGLIGVHGSGAAITNFSAVLLHPASRLRGNRAVAESLKLAAAHMLRHQHPNGLVDLLTTNFNSPPDTGFAVHGVATAAHLLRNGNQKELFACVEPFLRKAGAGLAVGGVHTPNHRWVVSSALAQLYELFPEPDYLKRIDQWLAEGVDIDDDGQYTEKSPTIYNAVCNRAFVVLATKLKRPEYFEPVRRNLATMIHLLHANGEVVTEMSTRQDRNLRAEMGAHWFPVRYMALRDGNGQLETLARQLDGRYTSLPLLMEYPELLGTRPAPVPLPDNFVRNFPATGIVRYRRGKTSATMLGDNVIAFSLHHGDAAITSVSFVSAFFGQGQFVGNKPWKRPEGFHMEQSLDWGYWQPFVPTRKIPAGVWGKVRSQRQRTEDCRLKQSMTVTQTADGFRLRIRANGTDSVPVVIRVGLPKEAKLEGCETGHPDVPGAYLPKDYATVTVGKDRIRFGPGRFEHSLIEMRGVLTGNLGDSPVYLTGTTPFDYTLELTVS